MSLFLGGIWPTASLDLECFIYHTIYFPSLLSPSSSPSRFVTLILALLEKKCFVPYIVFLFQASLMMTIINLAQNFVGSNNLNLLQPIGQFGTRLHGGKDSASPRYIFTMLRLVAVAVLFLDLARS